MQQPLQIGDIVASKAGHDEGRIYVITDMLEGGFVLIADGQYRKLTNKKRKREKHLRYLAHADLPDKPKITDIKKIVKEVKTEVKHAQR